ncbi:sarcosine oxidase subunit gamma family protein [Cohaesibacter sp. CAU 1516]|uniref:sarcosine oxidase subunit gamma n=1 Tax=Cohaesibacter sp. CAU 1516 TaxID=2576038 RepID=UPI0014857DB0|nr:sarcosine oxidase subunit gamma family protein [Cohaesibacter sp. CAU 1516]
MPILPDPLQTGKLIEQDALAIEVLPELQSRLSLRVAGGDRETLAAEIDIPLPDQIGLQAPLDGGAIACLGPDEWMMTLTRDLAALVQTRAGTASVPHALVDISSRELTLVISGSDARELLSVGCPRDLRSFTPGKACRTLCFDVPVILWCEAKDRYRLDVWRSFAPHLASLLLQSARAIKAEKDLSV